ncbi:uncharacterized protein LTR77_010140 [Saxophila tyrrhenica]|uniref:BTB domain-containing protein n=1 Tax=Saxophila tyrrhenica TaxID=1690608 RepID=A0AAV9NVZ0_9PEZI|nr:hypothetical protein LTR77_010140 [Saxophila tyrrhenica]
MADTSDRPAKKAKLQYITGITVLVGPEEASFHFTNLEEITANRSSAFFNAAFSGNWKEASTKVVHLPEVTPKTFRVYHEWICAGGEPSFRLLPYCYNSSALDAIVDAYILGDMLLDTDFRNALVDTAQKLLAHCINLPLIRHAKSLYENVPRRCKMGELFADFWIIAGPSLRNASEEMPMEFVGEIARACVKEMKATSESGRSGLKAEGFYRRGYYDERENDGNEEMDLGREIEPGSEEEDEEDGNDEGEDGAEDSEESDEEDSSMDSE